MKSSALTVEDYLAGLPPDRRETISAVRKVLLKNIPKGYVEAMNFGMISYHIPLQRYPDTYNKQPLSYIALGSQKNHCALYLMCVYASAERSAWLQAEFERAGKKLDMGKACLRFKKLDDLPLDVIAKVAGLATVEQYIAGFEKARTVGGNC